MKAKTRWGTVVTLPPAAGRRSDWLRFWRLREEEVVFREDGRVELPLQGYVRLRLHPVWAPDVSGMAGLLGLRAEDVVEQGDGWVLAPVPNAAMAVREGRVLLWCVDFVPRLDELEEMVLGTRYRQLHRFLEETERYRRRVGYRLTEEGELLYGGAVGGKVPLYHRVVLPTRLLGPEEALASPGAAPAAEWRLPSSSVPAAPAAAVEESEEERREGADAQEEREEGEETAEAAGRPAPVEAEEGLEERPAEGRSEEERSARGEREEEGEAVRRSSSSASLAITPERKEEGEAVSPSGRVRAYGEEREEEAGASPSGFAWPDEGAEERERLSPLRKAAGAIVRAAASLAVRPAGHGEEEERLTDYLQVVGGMRALLWALGQEGAAVRGAPAVWARGQMAGGVVELERELEERVFRQALSRAARSLGVGSIGARRVGARLWQLSPLPLPSAPAEAAAARLALVPIGRREEKERGLWVALADLGAPGGLLLQATAVEEERWLSWWTAAAALSLPGLVVWAEESVPVAGAARRFASSEELVSGLYEEVVTRFEELKERAPLLAIGRLPAERDRELLVTLAARGPEVGCYVVALGDVQEGRFPAWVKVSEGEVEAMVAGGRARLLPPEVEAPAGRGSASQKGTGVWPGPGRREGAPAEIAGEKRQEAGIPEEQEEAPAGLSPSHEAAPDGAPLAGEEAAVAERAAAVEEEEEEEEEVRDRGEAQDGREAEVEEGEEDQVEAAAVEETVPLARAEEEKKDREGKEAASLAGGRTGHPVAVRVLGPFSCSLELRRQAARELLSLLVLRQGEVGKEEAAALLEGSTGGQVERAFAMKRLANAVQDLRSACERAGIPKGVFHVRAGQVALVRDWVWSDLWEAEALLELLAEGKLEREGIGRLAELVRGEVLAGEVFSWAEEEGRRVARSLWWKLAEAAERLLSEERYEEACLLAEAARRLDPLEERPLRTQLRALAALGRRAQARQVARAYLRQLRRLLEDDEAEPEEETQQLIALLEDGDWRDLHARL